MPRIFQSDGASKGHPRIPAIDYGTKTPNVGSPVLNEAQLIQRGFKQAITQSPVAGPKTSFNTVNTSASWENGAVAVSDAGHLVGCYSSASSIRVSPDYGATWFSRSAPGGTSGAPSRVRSSPNGQRQWAMIAGDLCRSIDFGVTWAKFTSGFGDMAALSDDGQYGFQTYMSFGTRRLMIDGATWNLYGSTINAGSLLQMSRSGQYMAMRDVNAGALLVSTDYGSTWASRPNLTAAFNILDNGVFIAHTSTGIRKSTDFGATFSSLISAPTTNNLETNFSVSADGTYVLRGGSTVAPASLSRNGGTTWETLPVSFNRCAISPNGLRIVGIKAVAPFAVMVNDV